MLLLAGWLRGSYSDELALVGAVHRGDLLAQLALEPLHARLHPPQLVLEAEHLLDAGEVEPELGGQPLDQPQPLDVDLRVEARAAWSPARAHEPLRLVQAEGLRMHADEVGRDGDHVAGPIGHLRSPPRSARAGSRANLL